jgi:hypothetical protein
MKLEQFEKAKYLLSEIATLEKKASQKGEYTYVKIMVSTNNTSFTEISSIVDVDIAEGYKNSILGDCNRQKESLGEQIAKLQSQFDEL